MADTIAVMNGGKIEQAGSATDLYERPRTAFVANFLGISNLVDARMARRQRPRTVETHDGADAPRARALRPHGSDDVRIGVRPEKITLIRRASPSRRRQRARGKIVVAAFLGVSIQYVIQTAGGEELNVFAQNTDGAEPRGAGRRPRGAAGVEARSTRSWWPVAETRGGSSSAGRARSRWPARWRAAGSRGRSSARARRPRRSRRSRTRRSPIGDWTFSNWPLYIDKQVLKDFDKRYGGHVKYVEEINDNDEFYGKVRQQLQADQPIGRDIVALTDFMAVKWVRNRYVEPLDKKNMPNVVNEPRRQPQDAFRTTRARLHGAVAVGRRRARLQPEEDRPRAELGQRPLRPGVQGPRDDALRALRLGLDDAAGHGRRPDDGEDRPDPERDREDPARPPTPASSAASPATTTRPTWPRATSGSRSPTRATSSSSRATTRT